MLKPIQLAFLIAMLFSTAITATAQSQDTLKYDLEEVKIFSSSKDKHHVFDLTKYKTWLDMPMSYNTVFCMGVAIPADIRHWLAIKEIELPVNNRSKNQGFKLDFFVLTQQNGRYVRTDLQTQLVERTKNKLRYSVSTPLPVEQAVTAFYLFFKFDYGTLTGEAYRDLNNESKMDLYCNSIRFQFTRRFDSKLTYNYYFSDGRIKLKDENDTQELLYSAMQKGFPNLKIKVSYDKE